MIIKLELDYRQLDALHKVLISESNKAQDIDEQESCYVRMIEAKSKERGPNWKAPLMKYDVTLAVVEATRLRVGGPHLTPLSKLSNVFVAIGLFPEKDDVPVK